MTDGRRARSIRFDRVDKGLGSGLQKLRSARDASRSKLALEVRPGAKRPGAPHHEPLNPCWATCLDPEDYGAGRKLGRRLRAAGGNGIVYPSVRRRAGQCLGAFKPKAVGLPVQGWHLRYHWDGQRISRYFDYAEERWVPLSPPS